MSAERRWNQRRFRIEESTTQNGGQRTVFIEYMTPGTTVPPHYHTRFAETFDLLEGAITVYSSAQTPPGGDEGADLDLLEESARQLEPRKEATVPPGVYHKYLVGDEDTVLRVVVTPGDADFERVLMIQNGLAEDGELESLGDSVLLMVVISQCSSHFDHAPSGLPVTAKDSVKSRLSFPQSFTVCPRRNSPNTQLADSILFLSGLGRCSPSRTGQGYAGWGLYEPEAGG